MSSTLCLTQPNLAREADTDLASLPSETWRILAKPGESQRIFTQPDPARHFQTRRDLSDVARRSQTTHSQASLNPATLDINFESQFPQDFDPILGPFWLYLEPHRDLAREADPDLANRSESLPSQTQLGRQIQTWRDLSDVARHRQTTHRDPARFSQASLNPARVYNNFEDQFLSDFSSSLTPF